MSFWNLVWECLRTDLLLSRLDGILLAVAGIHRGCHVDAKDDEKEWIRIRSSSGVEVSRRDLVRTHAILSFSACREVL